MENLAIIIGRLGADPDLTQLDDGRAVARMSVATSEKWSDKKTGETREAVEWHRIEVWNKLGKACGEHLKKGALVFVRGELRTTPWEPSPGVTSYSTVIRADKVKFL